MEMKFNIEDIVKRYEMISKADPQELDRARYKISHDIKGAYGSLTSILSLIKLTSKESADDTTIGKINDYHLEAKNALAGLVEVLQSKSEPLTIDEIYSENTSTIRNNDKVREYSKTIYESAKNTLEKKPLLMSVINSDYRNDIDPELKELVEMGDILIDKIINTHNKFFSSSQESEYSKRNLAGEYLTNKSIDSYSKSKEASLIGKINTDLDSELISNEDIFNEYVLPLLDNIKDHAWEKKSSEFNNDIYNRESNLEKKCTIRTHADTQNKLFKISTIDNGYGIHPKMQDKIFSKGGTGRKEKEDHGLGLNLLKQKIESVGGKIYFQTEQGMGTTFTIEIPYKKEIIDDSGNKSYTQ